MKDKEKKIHIEDEHIEETPSAAHEPEEVAENMSAEEASSGEEAKEKTPLEAANDEIAQLKDQLLRTMAEFQNYKVRTRKEMTEYILNGGEKAITAILPILDDFERALSDKTEDAEAVKEGMSLIYKKFISTLEKLGVSKIVTDNADFNVDYHEAIAMVPTPENDKKGKIIDCVQTGYTLNNKVIRHAKVAVGQ